MTRKQPRLDGEEDNDDDDDDDDAESLGRKSGQQSRRSEGVRTASPVPNENYHLLYNFTFYFCCEILLDLALGLGSRQHHGWYARTAVSPNHDDVHRKAD